MQCKSYNSNSKCAIILVPRAIKHSYEVFPPNSHGFYTRLIRAPKYNLCHQHWFHVHFYMRPIFISTSELSVDSCPPFYSFPTWGNSLQTLGYYHSFPIIPSFTELVSKFCLASLVKECGSMAPHMLHCCLWHMA